MQVIVEWLQVVAAVVLIAIVMSQTTKQEGLGGAIGGKSFSSFKGKGSSREDTLKRLTMYAAIGFFIMSIIVFGVTEIKN
mgnify:CR=1 FL=1